MSRRPPIAVSQILIAGCCPIARAPSRPRRAPRCRRLLRLDRARSPSRAARSAGRRVRERPARRRHDRELRGAPLRRRLGDARLAGAPAVSRRRSSCRPTSPPIARSPREMMGIVRAHVERVEVVGLDEAYLDLSGLHSPRAAMRRLIERDQARYAAHVLGRHRPEQARGEGRLRRREAGRLRRAQSRAGMRPLCRLAAGARTRHRPEDRRASAELGLEHARRARRRARAAARRALRPQPRARAAAVAAASSTTAQIGTARKVVSESRERTFDYDLRDALRAARCAAGDGAGAVREPAAQRSAAGARSGSRCASTTGRRSRARTRCPSRPAMCAPSPRWRCGCCRSTRRRGRCGCLACASPGSPRAPGSSAPARRRRRRGQRCSADARDAADQLSLPLEPSG